MALWPFKRRKRSAVEGRKMTSDDPGIQRKPSLIRNTSKRGSVRRIPGRRNIFDREITPSPDYSLSPLANQQDSNTIVDHEFQSQEQSHQSEFSPYFVEHNRSAVTAGGSSTSSHRPHKQSSIIRKLSKRKNEKVKPQLFSIYHVHLGRQNSKNKRSRILPGRENDRPISSNSTVPRTSMESQISSRAYRLRSLDVFSPHPTLHYDSGPSATPNRSRDLGGPGLVPSRSNSRRTTSRATQGAWRYRGGPSISEEQLASRRDRDRVDDLVDGLDAKGLREAMERDQRRRDKRQAKHEERLRMIPNQADNVAHSGEAEQRYYHRDYRNPDLGTVGGSNPTRQDPRIEYAVSDARGTQTPLSWFNNNPSLEDMSEGPQFVARTDVVTPVSMDSQEMRREESRQASHNVKEAPEVLFATEEATTGRGKAIAWTSFIRRATATRIKKEHATRNIQTAHSTLLPGSEGEGFIHTESGAAPGTYLEVGDLRHREGQTPGCHVSKEVVLAMNALETGHIREKEYEEKEYEDEIRDSVLLAPAYRYHNGSSISSLAPFNLGLRGGTTKSQSPQLFEVSRDSPTILPLHPRPPSADRYSPSMHRYSSGAPSPDNGPRSVMSQSLASIDSEGSWLSGKINPRQSIQQMSPLRTSASSLRRRYQELDDDINMDDDDYFSGVRKGPKSLDGDDENGGTRLVLDDSDDGGSVNSEIERNMWREGMEKRIELRSGMRAMSRAGMLDDSDNVQQTPDMVKEIPIEQRSTSLQLEREVYEAPLGHSFARTTSTSSEFKILSKHPSRRMEQYGI